MTLGTLVPLALLLIAAIETVIVFRVLGKISDSGPTAPVTPGAQQRVFGLKIIAASAWLMPVVLYVLLNIVTDIGAMKIFYQN